MKKNNANTVWSAKEDAKLVKFREMGVAYSKIAALMNRTNDACRTRFKTLRARALTEMGEALSDVRDAAMEATGVYDEDVDSPDIDETGLPEDFFEDEDEENPRPESAKMWTKDDLETLYEMRRAHVPYSLIGLELKRTSSSCQSKYNTTDWESLGFCENDEEKFEDAEYAFKKATYRDRILRAADRRHENHKVGLDILGDRLERAVRALPQILPQRWDPNRPKGEAKEEDVMAMMSDLHIGAEHSLEETGGISKFNFDLLCKRISNYQYALRDIVELHSKMYPLRNLHVSCLGDIVAGDNSSGEWSQNYITMPIVDQVIEGYAKIRDMLAYWLSIFETITFYGVRGNHGRTGKRGVEKDYSNYDYLCYKFLQEAFRNNPRIKFVVPKTWWILANIKGHKFLMVHGDDINSGTPPVKKLGDFEAKMAGILDENPQYTLAGHFHNTAELGTNRGSLLINGSFVGGDIYSLKTVHANTRPEQTIFGINQSRGKTWKYNIDLDDARDPG
jgi:hypothetical protein